ncbi:MAG: glycosyl hydrolase [Bacteroidota bacterium]
MYGSNSKRLLLLSMACLWCIHTWAQALSDPRATPKARQLYQQLHTLSQTGILLGQEDALAYGVDWKEQPGRSDMKDMLGSHPAVVGWDLGDLDQTAHNLDTVHFGSMCRWIKDVYRMGGINTISWHLDNPVSGGSSWDKTPAVAQLLPGGTHHQVYKQRLDELARYLKKCRVGFTKVPIILRPFHEHNGTWFWWGKDYCTEEEYIALFRFTVDYLRQEKRMHQLLIAFSPDRSRMRTPNHREDYLYGYPGDEYVDIIGLDNYWDVGRHHNQVPLAEQPAHLVSSLELIVQLAEEKGKVAALTETGLEFTPHPTWFTDMLLEPLKSSPQAQKIAYLMLWRNAGYWHYYTPYPGHPTAPDYRAFGQDELILLQKDLPPLYRR